MLTRRDWLKLTAGGTFGAIVASQLGAADTPVAQREIPDYETPMFGLPGQVKEAVIVESIELLRHREARTWFVRMRARNGATSLLPTKQVENFVPIFERLVAPRFLGKDARDIETLVDDVQRANYKDVGIPFWCPVAYCELGALNLLGLVAGKPVGALLGGVKRREIPVYLSGSARELSAEAEVDVYVRGVAETGARAVKFKIGGRMSRNVDTYPGRTETLLKLSREKLPTDLTLYADANGSYNARKGIDVGRQLEELKYSFYEEPCPFEEISETQAVAQALKITIAVGEQDSSLWRFRWMMQNGVMRIAQPDLNYNGGFIRALRVAKMAEQLGCTIVPHNTQTGAASVNILQFASCVPNPGPFMEYPWRNTQQPASWYAPNFIIKDGRLAVPTGPGFGVTIDPDFVAQMEVVAKVG
jgi:L-alanine-DL-glutamate epimerase-like enolase superfamily enzyme